MHGSARKRGWCALHSGTDVRGAISAIVLRGDNGTVAGAAHADVAGLGSAAALARLAVGLAKGARAGT